MFEKRPSTQPPQTSTSSSFLPSPPANALSTFTFTNTVDIPADKFGITERRTSRHDVRVIEIDGEPWFVAADVCKALGLNVTARGQVNVTASTRQLRDDELGFTPIKTNSRTGGFLTRSVRTISESGLYKFVMRSDKPEAKAFQDWVTRDVLPAIRKNGGYVQGQEGLVTGQMTDAEFMAKALKMADATLKDAHERIAVLEGQAPTPAVSTFTFTPNESISISIRAMMIEGDPWFVAKDICDALGYVHTPSTLRDNVDPSQVNTVRLAHGNRGNPNRIVISEGGLYSLILGSSLPEAKKFKHWVTDDVIPAIRKSETYIKGEEKLKEGKPPVGYRRAVTKQTGWL